MGLFSWQCLTCKKSILGPYVLTDKNRWMNNAVAILRDGTFVRGSYDGYGRIVLTAADTEVDLPSKPDLYHQKCWESIGSPKNYTGGSPSAPDQGHFIDDKEYDLPEPS
jgi:hypothetical protein